MCVEVGGRGGTLGWAIKSTQTTHTIYENLPKAGPALCAVRVPPIVVRLALSVAGRLFITTTICHVPYDINEERRSVKQAKRRMAIQMMMVLSSVVLFL